MRAAALRYRVMAYITGVLIIVVCFVGIPLQIVAHNTIISNEVATVHGFLYIVYVVVAYLLAQKLKMRLWPTILLLLAGHGADHDVLRGAVDDARVHPPGAGGRGRRRTAQQPVAR